MTIVPDKHFVLLKIKLLYISYISQLFLSHQSAEGNNGGHKQDEVALAVTTEIDKDCPKITCSTDMAEGIDDTDRRDTLTEESEDAETAKADELTGNKNTSSALTLSSIIRDYLVLLKSPKVHLKTV